MTELLTADMIAQALDVSRKTALVYMRTMPKVKIGKSYLVKVSDFDRWIDARRELPEETTYHRRRRSPGNVIRSSELFEADGGLKRRVV